MKLHDERDGEVYLSFGSPLVKKTTTNTAVFLYHVLETLADETSWKIFQLHSEAPLTFITLNFYEYVI